MNQIWPALVYLLCFATSFLCAFLLGRSFIRTRSRMLLWSSVCFSLFAVVNFIVFLDMLIFPDVDLRPIRLWLTLVGVSALLFGFIWDDDQ